MSSDVSRIVGVNISVSPLALQRAGFGILNIIGVTDVIPTEERVREYNSMTDVAADFADTDEEYLAAQIFFSQVPRPTVLYISRRNTVATKAELVGGAASTLPGDFSSYEDADIDINIDGTVRHLTGLDFSAITTMEDVAAVLQTALNAAVTGTTCTWSATTGKFTITNATAGSSHTLSFMVGVSEDDIVQSLCLGSACGGSIIPGFDVETAAQCLNAIEEKNSKWYGFAFTKEVNDDQIFCLAAAAWAEARTKLFCNTTKDANTIITGNTSSLAYALKTLDYSRTFSVYGPTVVDSEGDVIATNDYAAISVFARGATVDFNAENSTITYKFKQCPGIAPVDLSATHASNLIAANCNYYTQFGTALSGDAVTILAEGVCANGRFLDEVVGIDWLQNAIQTDVFNFLFQSTTKIPQTDAGVTGIVQVLSSDLEQAVTNGLAAPGYVTIGGQRVFLPKGYHIFQGLTENQNQADREARKAPPISFILKGAGAIHSVTITGTFVR